MITITINEDRSYEISGRDAGVEGENNVTMLSVTVPERFRDYDKYLKFQTATGVKTSSPKYGVGETTFECALPAAVLVAGPLLMAVKCEKPEDAELPMWSSHIISLYVSRGINANEYIIEHSPDILQDHEERITAAESGKENAGTASALVTEHDSSAEAHADLLEMKVNKEDGKGLYSDAQADVRIAASVVNDVTTGGADRPWSAEQGKALGKDVYTRKFGNSELNIAYSYMSAAPINSAEQFIMAYKLGFNACKGDVQPTSDGKLVMCHDPGLTFNVDGRITDYSSSNNTLIHDLTYEQCMAFEYSMLSSQLGDHYAKMCDFETYIRICKRYGMVAYATIRENYLDVVVPGVLDILKKYDMFDWTIINSFPSPSFDLIRAFNKRVTLSRVLPTDAVLTTAHIDEAIAKGNYIVTMYCTSFGMGEGTVIGNSASAIAYAREHGVPLFMAVVGTHSDYAALCAAGFTGIQINKPILQWDRKTYQFKINIASGTPSLANWFGTDRYTATVWASANIIRMKDFYLSGSTLGFADGIMVLWMRTLPYRLSVTSVNGNTVSILWDNTMREIRIVTADININDTLWVTIEV